ncbi:hypothetical protein [Paenibacillus thalictri]|uniref:Dihydroorotate dehydrogenase catalytic domain-containing protein n=1 Tax=Paenibacillus thalictri TaxID=2527873 RepID=A0A4Q9DPI8_9BACL|nr:hypothetical protein [Paenibacillus thalictri]TBL75138.1 hypothetical protein EYB31_24345 [Paenibacillus thalictri]
MPDWSYQTLFKPALFKLPAERARDVTLRAMGTLSSLPGGTWVIKTMGHMESYSDLHNVIWGTEFKYPIGLSGRLDVHGTAHKALAPFGFGYFEIGPVTVEKVESGQSVYRDLVHESIVYPDLPVNDGLDAWIRRLQRKRAHSKPYIIRLSGMPGADIQEAIRQIERMAGRLAAYADGFVIDLYAGERRAQHVLDAVEEAGKRLDAASCGKPLLLYVPADFPEPETCKLVLAADRDIWKGMVIGDAVHMRDESGDWLVVGPAAKQPGIAKIRLIRELCGEDWPIVASGGVNEPQDALELYEAGAQLVQLHSGLVYAGPGLPKRINEAVVYRKTCGTDAEPAAFWRSWGWMCFLGLGMVIGGILAWLIASTLVVLPYDIEFLGISSAALSAANLRLLPFMSHDRITLAGTMISIGVLYFMLARYGLKAGLHWCKTALLASGGVGFGSFFLFLGYGYFDPLHAAVAVMLLPMFVLSMRGRADTPSRTPPNLHNDKLWRRAQWGQLMLVSLGFALAAGGALISYIGITRVFVVTDLEFLCASPDMLKAINEKLLPLIAHDRAGFGGALFADAIALLAAALWGVREGERWLWWMFLLGGLPGFAAGFLVHFTIGYTDFWHLFPAYLAFGLFAAGLYLLYPFMAGRRLAEKSQQSRCKARGIGRNLSNKYE